ncbi:hypothetical protein HMPREF1548_04064 [Clostridium sp. KLE 1755]|nr:hypothetical protein HMPREF1548_04064 [Clostridium sp. KLE 1755]
MSENFTSNFQHFIQVIFWTFRSFISNLSQGPAKARKIREKPLIPCCRLSRMHKPLRFF